MIRSRAYKIKDTRFTDWETEVKGKWTYDDFLNRPDYAQDWISLTSLASDDRNQAIYVGLGSFSGDLLYGFDRKSKTFRSLHYQKVAKPYDGKFHCSLEMDANGQLYGAIAQFHDVDKQFEAEGGRLVQYDIQRDAYRFLGIPVKGSYIQSIALDADGKMLYGYTLSPEYFFKHDLQTNDTTIIANVGNSFELCQPHNPVIDDEGRVWGTYGITRAFSYATGDDSIRLFYYDPAREETKFLPYGLPRLGRGDKGQVDRAINGRDGFLYFGGVNGSFSRLNPRTGEIKSYGKPCPNSRLAGLCVDGNGYIYGVGGDCYYVTVFRFDPRTERLTLLGRIFDETIQEAPVRIHAIAITEDGILYCGENDNNDRSSYLWECELD